MNKIIFPSIYGLELKNNRAVIEEMLKTELVNVVHFDVMDGIFSKNKFNGLESLLEIKDLLSKYKVVADIHILTINPLIQLQEIIKMNLDFKVRVSVHSEAKVNLKDFIITANSNGIVPGVSIKLKTKIKDVDCFNDFSFYNLICNNEDDNIKDFQDESYSKITLVRSLVGNNKEISVDCGIKQAHIEPCIKSGCNNLIMGSAIFSNDDPINFIKDSISNL